MHFSPSPTVFASYFRKSLKKVFWLGLSLLSLGFIGLGSAGPAIVQAACAGGYGVNLVQAGGSPMALAMGATPFSIATGDFNNDSKPDLAVPNFGNNNVAILLGDGAGGFSPASGSPFLVGSNPISIAVGDFNKDNHLDLVTANNSGSNLTVLLGDGMGGFGAPNFLTTSPQPYAVVVADFNNDTKLDVASANATNSDISVLLGDGSGIFTGAPNSPYSIGNGANFPVSLSVGDFNGDNKLDLVTANSGSNNISILQGDGQGRFSPFNNSPIAVGHNPNSVIVADFNSDNKLDLAIANIDTNNISVLLGNGAAGFSPSANSPFATGANSGPRALVTGDFNGDGKLDLASALGGVDKIAILVGDATGDFSLASGGTFNVGSLPAGVAASDFNSDGKLDLANANLGASSVNVFLNQPNLTLSSLQLTAPTTVAAGSPITATVTALDSCGSIFTGYNGTVAFSSGDTAAGLPANYSFLVGDDGTKTFTNGVTFYTGGSRNLTVSDTVSNSLTISQNVTVTNFVVTANSDPAGASPPMGTLSYALKNANPTNGQQITFKSGITTVNVTGHLPDVPAGVTINGGSCSNTPIFINGVGASGDGLTLKGGVTIQNLRIANFPGRQIVAGVTAGGAKNTLVCIKVSKNYS